MKATRRMITTITTMAMAVSSVPLMAAADNLEVTYNAEPTYTVTIPAGVTLSATDTQTATIEASDVMLEKDTAISVKLGSASNTESGSTFSAKTTDGASTASYTISKGETAIAVGDEVASFTENGTQDLTFSTATGATAAGSHTETLTFNISVTEPEPEPEPEPERTGFLKEGDILEYTFLFKGLPIDIKGTYVGGDEIQLEERHFYVEDYDFDFDINYDRDMALFLICHAFDPRRDEMTRFDVIAFVDTLEPYPCDINLKEGQPDDIRNMQILVNSEPVSFDFNYDVW